MPELTDSESDDGRLQVGKAPVQPRVRESLNRSKEMPSPTPSEISIYPSSSAVPQEMRPDMPFLAQIEDEDIKSEVITILTLKNVTKKGKLDSLADLVTYKIYMEIDRWLEEKENGTDFLEHMSLGEIDMRWLVNWTKKLKAPVIEGMLKEKGASAKAMECFERWKEKNGLNQQPSTSKETKMETKTKEIVELSSSRKEKSEDSVEEEERKKAERRRRKEKEEEEERRRRRKERNKEEERKKESSSRKEKEKSEDSDEEEERRRRKEERRRRGEEREKEEEEERKREKEKRKKEKEREEKKEKQKKPKEPNVSDEYATPDEGDGVEIINFLPQEVNIVLLGGTGIGKSTFINSIANMFSHSTLEEAMMDLHVLIRTSFHHISENHEQRHIVVEPTIQVERQGEADNEGDKVGESCTKHPRSYVFKYGRKNERTLRIIDTPGVGDTNGVEQDREHFRHIINFVSSFREIHAFLFLMKPNDSRLELHFRYCINELLTHLHVSATNNIIFTFTNGRGTNYKPSETFGTLQALLNSVKEERGVEIQLKDRCLVFDNESYRYLCECQYGIEHKDWEVENYKKSWTHGKKELFKMLEMIVCFEPHDVNNTLSVNKVRRAIEIMARPLAELAKNLLINIQLIQEKEAEIEECLRNKTNFEDRLFTRQIQMRTEELEDPMTVCQHEDCIDRVPLHEGGVEEIVYRKPCHEECYLLNIEPGEPPGEAIKSCEIFGNVYDEYTCSVCDHSYQDHLHMRYRFVREVTEVLDRTIQEALASTNNKKEVAQDFLVAKRTERDALERNLLRKQTICAHFAIFLKDNSVLAYNDQYLAYLNGLIREEREKVNRSANGETLARLESCHDQYKELKKVFDNPATGKKMTLIEIEDLIEEIKRMDDGDLIRDVHSLEISYPAHKALDAPAIKIKQKTLKGMIKDGCNSVKKIKDGAKKTIVETKKMIKDKTTKRSTKNKSKH